jgi:uncharacterized protein (TIGR02099 family)
VNALWLRRLHRCARALGWLAGTLVILLAVLMALAQLLLPLVARHPAWVAAQLSQRLARPVSFDSLEGRWAPSGPMFVLHRVAVGAASGQSGHPLQVPEVDLKIDFGGLLAPSRHLLSVHVRGLQLALARAPGGGWQLNGFGLGGDARPASLPLGRFSLDLWLENLQVAVSDASRRYIVLVPQLRLSRQGNEVCFAGTLRRGGETAALRTVGRFREDGSAGRLWVGVDEVDLQPLLAGFDLDGYTAAQGHGQIAAWLAWRRGRVDNSVLRLDLDNLTLIAPSGATARVAGLHGLAGLRRIGDGYAARWAGDDGGALAVNLHQPGNAQASIDVAARNLQLAPLLPWLALKPGLSPALGAWLGAGRPRGELSVAALQWRQATGLQAVDLAFTQLAVDAVGALPGISGVRGELRGDAQALSLQLTNQAAVLQLPQMFRQPLTMSAVGGTLAFWQQDGDWHLGADALDLAGAGYAGQARGEVVLPAQGGKPMADLYVKLDHAQVGALKQFLPINVMPVSTIQWLDRALVSGQLDQAQILLHGDLADWPFRHNEGRFEARAAFSNLTVNYGKDWPQGQGLDLVASFVNNGMLAEVSAGQSLGVTSDNAVALIPDFADGLLDLNVHGSGSGAQLMNFVRNSPIGRRQADTLAKLNLGGSGSFEFHLSLPLKNPAAAQLSGTALLKDADLSAPAWHLQLDKLNGPLRFDAHGMQAGPLDAIVHGQPSTLQLALAGGNGDPATVLSAQLRGSYSFAELVQRYPNLQWLGQAAQGRSDFTVGFTIAHVPQSDAVTQDLTLDSTLSGIALALPAPLDKRATLRLPLHLDMSLPVQGADLQFALGNLLRGRLRLPADDQHRLAGTLALGSQMPVDIPQQGLRIRGHAGRLDVTGWVQHVVSGSGAGGEAPGLEGVDLGADQAELFGRPFGAMKIRVTTQPTALAITVDGAAMAGSLNVPTQDMDKRGITARLQRLYWLKDPPTDARPSARAAAGASAPPPPADPANTGIDPAALPPLHLWVADLRLGDAKLGDARLETWPSAAGMHIEQLRALSSRAQINASGDWNGSASNSHSHMKIGFAADDLGGMLGAFGFQGLVNGGKTRDQLDASWPGPPSALSLANMDGTLSIHVSDGRIPEASSPGVGRLLGLVSLAELPRRLTLDFGDVFGKGLAFDTIAGDFRLADGNATTGNLVIQGPSANISITGRTGLRAHDYNQQVQVVPHIGNSLPLVGAVVGGPIGAAAGFAVQGLLGKGLNRAATARYSVTGSWDKPVMTLIEKHAVAPPTAPLTAPYQAPLTAPYETPLLPTAPGTAAAPAAASSVGAGP